MRTEKKDTHNFNSKICSISTHTHFYFKFIYCLVYSHCVDCRRRRCRVCPFQFIKQVLNTKAHFQLNSDKFEKDLPLISRMLCTVHISNYPVTIITFI